MKRSLIRSLTALAVTTLLMLALAPAANAAPWGLAVESGFRGAGWFESAREWLQGLLGIPSAPAPKAKQKAVQQGKGDGDDPEARPNGDTGCVVDPTGAPCTK
ncbi:MAG TPA: hypothetical protein VGC93_17920 [Thermoanaerobaculia bacterium]